MGLHFYETILGRRFYESTMPGLKNAAEKNAESLGTYAAALTEHTQAIRELTDAIRALEERLRWK